MVYFLANCALLAEVKNLSYFLRVANLSLDGNSGVCHFNLKNDSF